MGSTSVSQGRAPDAAEGHQLAEEAEHLLLPLDASRAAEGPEEERAEGEADAEQDEAGRVLEVVEVVKILVVPERAA